MNRKALLPMICRGLGFRHSPTREGAFYKALARM